MTLEWSLVAQTYFDQLPPADQSRVLHAVQDLPEHWDGLEVSRLKMTRVGDLYSVRAGSDIRVLVRRRNDDVNIVDIVRRSQIDSLSSLGRLQAAAG